MSRSEALPSLPPKTKMSVPTREAVAPILAGGGTPVEPAKGEGSASTPVDQGRAE